MKSLKQKRPRNERTTQQKDDKQNCLLRPHLRSWNPMGMWLGKHSSFSPSSFFSFFFFFVFSCPSLLRSFLFDEVVGVQREAARLGYRPGTKRHGKSKLWLVRGKRCRESGSVARCVGSLCMLILRSAVTPGWLRTLKSKKKCEVKAVHWYVTSYQITSPPVPASPHSNRDVCLAKKTKKKTHACQTSGGPTNQWLNPSYACVAEVTQTPRKSDNEGIWCQERSDLIGQRVRVRQHCTFFVLRWTTLGRLGDRGCFHFSLTHGWHVSKISACVCVCVRGGCVWRWSDGWGVGSYTHNEDVIKSSLALLPTDTQSTQRLANPTQAQNTHTCIHTLPSPHRAKAQIISTIAVPYNKRGIWMKS